MGEIDIVGMLMVVGEVRIMMTVGVEMGIEGSLVVVGVGY